MAADNTKIESVRVALKRIFALPVNKSTFRQVQNAVAVIFQSEPNHANEVLEALFTGNFKNGQESLKGLYKEYDEQLKVAREVFERGSFLTLITSDRLAQGDRVMFNNLIRRIDGEQIEFITDIESTFQMIKHFIGRLQEVQSLDVDKKLREVVKNEIADLHRMTDTIIAAK
ncbi:MAG: CT_584 family protein [Parachlamydiales bacterium]|jgi:hypothetical protein